jgi:hypothetical protein
MTILDPSPRPGRDGRDAAKPDPRAGKAGPFRPAEGARNPITTLFWTDGGLAGGE